MDISKFDFRKTAEAGSLMTLRDPVQGNPIVDDETGNPLQFLIVGEDSKAGRRIAGELQREMLGAAILAASKSKDSDDKVDEAELRAIRRAAAVCVNWTADLVVGGRKLDPASLDDRIELFTAWNWAVDQIIAHHKNRSNFMPVA